MAERFRYDLMELNESTIAIDTTSTWIRHKVIYDAAYDNERITAYLCLPKHLDPPYQVIVFFPGTDARDNHSSDDFYPAGNSRYLLEHGRAVLHPVYKGTHERRLVPMPEEGTRANAEYYYHVIQDVMRSIDYLETRDDINTEKIGYMGFSWGAATPAILTLALEKRIRASVLFDGGLFNRSPRDISPVHYAPRITASTLLINGEWDQVHPYESTQLPLFNSIGAEIKEHLVLDGGHVIIATKRREAVRRTLEWLDEHLGPVFPGG